MSLTENSDQCMSGEIPYPLLENFTRFISDQIGFCYTKANYRNLEKTIKFCARDLGYKDAVLFIKHLMSSETDMSDISILAKHFAIGETYFFRENKMFEVIENTLLPELFASVCAGKKRISIWSAGCSSGEEPYSMAILLNKAMPRSEGWSVDIFATDINTASLERAKRGLYGHWSFREESEKIMTRNFSYMGDGIYELDRSLRSMVTFSYHNLASDNYTPVIENHGNFDLILCRNVLLYFLPEVADKVIGKFYSALSNGGYLIVSLTEMFDVLPAKFQARTLNGVTVYRKCDNVDAYEKESDGYPAAQKPKTCLPAERSHERVFQEALLLYKKGMYLEAADLLKHAEMKGAADSKICMLLSNIYTNIGKQEDALAYCRKAYEDEKLSPGYHYYIASILEDKNRYEEAITSLNRAIYLDPGFILAHFALGNIRVKTGRVREAEKHYRNALTLLKSHEPGEILTESSGITAGMLTEIIEKLK